MYHPQVGDPLEALDTPVMLVDLDLMENNIASLMARFRERRVLVRPHLKTVKSPELARVLLAAGASDGCVANVSEAEVMVQGGIEDLLITTEIVGKPSWRASSPLCSGIHVSKLWLINSTPAGRQVIRYVLEGKPHGKKTKTLDI
jgi:D-serine deaminase-like pyridoxal phosphate-dependent protein